MILIYLIVNYLYRKHGVPLHNFFENLTRGISHLKCPQVGKTLRSWGQKFGNNHKGLAIGKTHVQYESPVFWFKNHDQHLSFLDRQT